MNENNNENVNITNDNIVPIPEVKVENQEIANINIDNNANRDNVVSDNQVYIEPPKNGKGTTILLILLFVFLFAYVMAMPYITEFVNEMKNKDNVLGIVEEQSDNSDKNNSTDEVKTKELVCTSTSNIVGNYTLVQIQKFYYDNNNQILTSKLISQYSFSGVDATYEALKKQCDEDSLKYLTHDGYTIACSYDDVSIEIGHEFDLESFSPIVDGETNIQANATYKQKLDEVKTNLINQGYTCK